MSALQYYLYMILCIFFDAVLAITYKLSSRERSSPQIVLGVAYCMAFAVAAGSFFMNVDRSFHAPVILLGVGAGIMVCVAGFSFIMALKFGKLSLGWTIRTFAIAIPIVASIIFWQEKINWKSSAGLCSLIISIVLAGTEKENVMKKEMD